MGYWPTNQNSHQGPSYRSDANSRRGLSESFEILRLSALLGPPFPPGVRHPLSPSRASVALLLLFPSPTFAYRNKRNPAPRSLPLPHPSRIFNARCAGGVRKSQLSKGQASGRGREGCRATKDAKSECGEQGGRKCRSQNYRVLDMRSVGRSSHCVWRSSPLPSLLAGTW